MDCRLFEKTELDQKFGILDVVPLVILFVTLDKSDDGPLGLQVHLLYERWHMCLDVF